MATRGAQIIHAARGFVIDRIQTGGPGQVNVNEEKIYELGNFESVGSVRDNPDLQFSMESLDVSTEIEALLTFEDPSAVTTGQKFDFQDHVPLDIISPFKETGTSFDISHGVVLPYLTLESASYSFGLRDNATQSFNLRGDSIFYVSGSPYQEEFTITAGANQTYTLSETALLYEESGDDYYVLGACAKDSTNKTYKRLFLDTDYTNTSTDITTLDDLDGEGYDELHVVYATSATQSYPQTVHQGTSVKPAAVRGRDIDIYLGDNAATPTFTRWRGVQSADINWSVTLDADEEFGNSRFVAQDYEIPDVSGSVTMRSRDAAELFSKIQEIADVTNNVVGPLTSVELPLEIRISDPDTGSRLKTFYIPDAEFTPPAMQGQVQTKLENTFNFSSQGGSLEVYEGAR